MYTNIIGTQQIVITAVFLGVMILLLIILRRKSTVIRASMKAGKRVFVIEDTAVSPTERLRLIKIDTQEFVMVSAKGHAPSLVLLAVKNTGPNLQKNHTNAVASDREALDASVSDTPLTHAIAEPFAESEMLHSKTQKNVAPPADQHEAFAKTFQSWRQQNATR